MKRAGVLMSALLLFVSCAANKLAKTTVYTHSTVEFKPTSVSKTIAPDVSLAIEPIDARDLNIGVFESYNRDGGYEKEHTEYHAYMTKDGSSLPLNERRKFKNIEKRFEIIDNMLAQGDISSMISALFKEKIYLNEILDRNTGLDGSETRVFNGGKEIYDDLNPYKIDTRYLSLFKITLNNKSGEIRSFNIEDFQVSSANEQLYPFKMEYFESTLKGENEKMKYIYRMNMPNELKVTPRQTVEKYIATPAINIGNDTLMISYISNDSVTEFPFSVSIKTIDEKHSFSAYSFTSFGEYSHIIVELPSGIVFPLKTNTLYINDKTSNERIKVYAIGTMRNQTYYSETSFIPSQMKKRKIKLSYDKKS